MLRCWQVAGGMGCVASSCRTYFQARQHMRKMRGSGRMIKSAQRMQPQPPHVGKRLLAREWGGMGNDGRVGGFFAAGACPFFTCEAALHRLQWHPARGGACCACWHWQSSGRFRGIQPQSMLATRVASLICHVCCVSVAGKRKGKIKMPSSWAGRATEILFLYSSYKL